MQRFSHRQHERFELHDHHVSKNKGLPKSGQKLRRNKTPQDIPGIVVTLHRIDNLVPAKGYSGMPDPFVIISIGSNSSFTTKPRKRTLSPRYDESRFLPCNESFIERLTIRIFGGRRIFKLDGKVEHEYLGEGSIDLSSLGTMPTKFCIPVERIASGTGWLNGNPSEPVESKSFVAFKCEKEPKHRDPMTGGGIHTNSAKLESKRMYGQIFITARRTIEHKTSSIMINGSEGSMVRGFQPFERTLVGLVGGPDNHLVDRQDKTLKLWERLDPDGLGLVALHRIGTFIKETSPDLFSIDVLILTLRTLIAMESAQDREEIHVDRRTWVKYPQVAKLLCSAFYFKMMLGEHQDTNLVVLVRDFRRMMSSIGLAVTEEQKTEMFMNSGLSNQDFARLDELCFIVAMSRFFPEDTKTAAQTKRKQQGISIKRADVGGRYRRIGRSHSNHRDHDRSVASSRVVNVREKQKASRSLGKRWVR